jgi:NADPH-dependent ferric siderophore reductase
MSAAHPAIARSLENLPEPTTFKVTLRAQALEPAYKWARPKMATSNLRRRVDLVLTRPAVGEAVDEPRVSMEVENHWLVRGENSLELTVYQTVRVFRIRNQFE